MQSERRDLESFGKGLTDDQIIEKKRMLKESDRSPSRSRSINRAGGPIDLFGLKSFIRTFTRKGHSSTLY